MRQDVPWFIAAVIGTAVATTTSASDGRPWEPSTPAASFLVQIKELLPLDAPESVEVIRSELHEANVPHSETPFAYKAGNGEEAVFSVHADILEPKMNEYFTNGASAECLDMAMKAYKNPSIEDLIASMKFTAYWVNAALPNFNALLGKEKVDAFLLNLGHLKDSYLESITSKRKEATMVIREGLAHLLWTVHIKKTQEIAKPPQDAGRVNRDQNSESRGA